MSGHHKWSEIKRKRAIRAEWCSEHDSEVDNDNGLCLAWLMDPTVPDASECKVVHRHSWTEILEVGREQPVAYLCTSCGDTKDPCPDHDFCDGEPMTCLTRESEELGLYDT